MHLFDCRTILICAITLLGLTYFPNRAADGPPKRQRCRGTPSVCANYCARDAESGQGRRVERAPSLA